LPALADSKVRIVRVSYVEGDVQLDRGDGHGFIRAFQNMPVIEGVRLWTRSDARAEVEFEDGSTLRLVPDSLVNFEELRTGNSGEKITRVDVQQGTLYADLKDHDHDQLAFTFAQQELTLRHSSRFRLDIDKEQLKVAVFRGEVELQRHNAERVKIKKNETLAIDLNEPERYYLSKGIVEEPHDYWDREREGQRVEAENRYRSRTYPVSTVYYGYDDLSPYGSWVLVPTYGYVWRPYNVAFGWDPFAYGAWVYYPGFGYVWNSAYPWGWTPYRYGSWVFINNRGWCWRGGPRINITNINIVNAPPAYVAPRPPTVVNTNIVTVNNGVPRPADPRGAWLPRVNTGSGYGRGATGTPGVFTAVTENEPRPGIAGKRPVANDDAVPARDNAAERTPASGIPRDIQRSPGVSTKTAIDGSTRIRTHDSDYNAVDYRTPPANQANRPATTPGNDVVEASRIQRGRPDPDRDDISRGSTNRAPAAEGRLTTPDSDGPRRNSAPAADRSDSSPAPRSTPPPQVDRQVDRPAPQPQVSRPTPQMDRPAPQPQVSRPTPQMDRPAPQPQVNRPAPAPRETPRSFSPAPSAPVQRSSPPSAAPAMSVPRSAPAPSPAPARSGGNRRDQ
jgi:hypothetical protein